MNKDHGETHAFFWIAIYVLLFNALADTVYWVRMKKREEVLRERIERLEGIVSREAEASHDGR